MQNFLSSTCGPCHSYGHIRRRWHSPARWIGVTHHLFTCEATLPWPQFHPTPATWNSTWRHFFTPGMLARKKATPACPIRGFPCPQSENHSRRLQCLRKKHPTIFVIPRGARNLSWFSAHEKKERFLAPLGMTKIWNLFHSLFRHGSN